MQNSIVQLRQERWRAGVHANGQRAAQANLAHMAGIDPRTRHDLERGRTTPKSATLTTLLEVLAEFAPLPGDQKKRYLPNTV